MKKTSHDIQLPRERLLCQKCESANSGTIRFILANEIFPMESVEVLSLSNEYDENKKLYQVNARIKWKCPDCGIPLEGVAKLKELPIEIVRQISNTCPNCDGKLILSEEKIKISKINSFNDTITLSGYLICEKCTNKKSYIKSIKAAFSPVFNYLDSIKKIKISDKSIEFERE